MSSYAWPEPTTSRSKVDAAGAALLTTPPGSAERLAAEVVVNEWRVAHAYPMHAIRMTLKGRAKSVEKSALVAHRLKRLSSIELKLALHDHMKLSQMQDIGGCRAVVSNVVLVDKLVAKYKTSFAKNPHTTQRSQLISEDDYITTPKNDGYRSFHLIYKYHSHAPSRRPWDTLRIELQLRTAEQHAWATAVETTSTFTGQALKSNIGEQDWKRFFALMSSSIALREGRPIVPNTPDDPALLTEELRDLNARLNVETRLKAWSVAVQTTMPTPADFYLLVLDPTNYTLQITSYPNSQIEKANEDYSAAETQVADIPGGNAVLVSTESIAALRKAYPNYFLDTTAFLDALRLAVGRS